MGNEHEHLGEHVCERYLAGFLDEGEAAAVTAAAAACGHCRERLERSRQSAEAFLSRHVPQAQAHALLGKRRSQLRWPRWLVGTSAATAMAAVLLLWLLPEQPKTTTAKGDTASFYLATDNGEEPVAGTLALEGRVRVRVKPPRGSWQVIAYDSRTGAQVLAQSVDWSTPADPVVEVQLDGDRGALMLASGVEPARIARLREIFSHPEPSATGLRDALGASAVEVLFLKKSSAAPHTSGSPDVGRVEPQSGETSHATTP